ncbi:MAG: insulinase family protein [Kiritimatiellae bacterium]|nr:insulinase family protein [Kiritimatiellia bacterium]
MTTRKKVAMKMAAGCALMCGMAYGELTPGASIHGFTVTSVTKLPEVKGRLVRMTYAKNGADLAWLDRDDDNKTFAIVFRTIPEDDTGVAHILEHSVLCGSEKYPVKEPFVELLKSSFSTFLNAFTSSDWTAYPVCSRNDADFLNLMDVYLDAVFHPLSVKGPLPFRQEGWHYELKDGELTRNGVVMSEMKGAFGAPERLAYHELRRLMFPDNCYGFVSGGDPASIHKLTFEQYKDFYRRHYHPSNARIFLDGRVDIPAALAKLDSYLSVYKRTEIDTAVPLQKPVRTENTIQYEVGADDSAADKTFLLEGWVIGTFRDRETRLAFDVLSDVIAGSNEDPLAKALLANGLCEEVRLGIGGAEQLTATLQVKNAKDGKADEIRRIVRETFERLAGEGLDRARLNAVLDRHEFNDREKDSGGFPRGLLFFEDSLDQWLYGGDPAEAFRFDHLYRSLRAKVGQGWFEEFLRRTLIDNPHHVKLTMTASKTLAEERRKAEKEELAAIQAKWTPAEREQVMAECKALEAFQKKADSPEDLAKLPMLSLKDIPEKGPAPESATDTVGGVKVIRAKTSANGIAYLELYFELRGLTCDGLSDAAILAGVLEELPTAKRSVLELKNALDAGLGRFETSVAAYAKPSDPMHAKAYLAVRVSALESKLGEIVRLVPEVLLETSFADAKLMGDLVKQRRRAIERGTMGIGGRIFAGRRAAASQSARGMMEEQYAGLSHLRRVQDIDDGFAKNGAAFCERLAALSRRVFVRSALTACLSDNTPTAWLERLFAKFPQGKATACAAVVPLPARREGFRTAGRIGSAAKASFPMAYSGSGRVAAKMLSLDYLWNEIRVLGGAYGGGFKMTPEGDARYLSWNDPNPARSLGVYDRSGDALRKMAKDEPSIDKYIISTVSDTEPYQTPSVETTRAAELVLSGRTPEDLQKLRREMLRTTRDDLLRFADTLDSLTNSTAICVIGGAAQLEGCTNMLDTVESVAR